jgi:hypothetical protein
MRLYVRLRNGRGNADCRMNLAKDDEKSEQLNEAPAKLCPQWAG